MKKTLFVLIVACMFANSAFAQDKLVEVVNSDQIFQKGYIQVIGESESGQSRYRAKRAAEVVAQKRLLEIFQGLTLSGETTVQDGMLSSETIKTKVAGTLRGATPCGEAFDRTEGYARVCLRLNLHGNDSVYSSFKDIIVNNPNELKVREMPAFVPASIPAVLPPTETIPTADEKVEVPVKTEKETPAAAPVVKVAPVVAVVNVDGIIVDVRNFDFKPALVNRILTENNEVLFDPSKVLNQVLIERGCGGYTTDLQKAKALLESWGSKSPMILHGKTVQNVTDAVVSSDDATALFAYDQKFNILAQAKVVFVLK
ncbi:hypothetical protein [Desulfovibrio sp. UCD-KL4C]|uniref:hypothetical protein n=1 Tax=Desulfovibrio sp. UCD-KL4C TaxID=2578120 RepID=UPI0025B9DEC5|nr:hypothetical protein [Desulfovibrio sp. UCD-KL4C]